MDGCCNDICTPKAQPSPRYRRVLWIALWVNTLMFGIEVIGGISSGSVSLLADAADFAGDAANYGLSLAVLSMGLMWRARAALVKGMSMGVYGLAVIVGAVWVTFSGSVPEPVTMGGIAIMALIANVAVAILLYAFRDGDANMRSVWLCSRNDAIGNVAVIFAALGVFGTGSGWPDLVVAFVMGALALQAAKSVMTQARHELNSLP